VVCDESTVSQAAGEPTQTQVMLSHSGSESSLLSHSDAQKGNSTLFRTSATGGNNVGVSRTTLAKKSKQSKAEPEVESMTVAGGFSDEDDSIERASILQSPLKGENRLSSVVSGSHISVLSLIAQQAVVKVEKPSSSNKSRSRENILGRDIVSG
jgi:hypothetical protein